MMSLLYAMMMLLSPMSAGGNGNGHHYGWRNQAPRSVPGVTVVSSPRSGGGTNQNPPPGTPTGDPTPGPFVFQQ